MCVAVRKGSTDKTHFSAAHAAAACGYHSRRYAPQERLARSRLEANCSQLGSDGFPLCVREDSIQELLTSVPLLKSLDESEREAVAEALGYETYEYGEAIVEQGDDGDEVSCAYLAALFPR